MSEGKGELGNEQTIRDDIWGMIDDYRRRHSDATELEVHDALRDHYLAHQARMSDLEKNVFNQELNKLKQYTGTEEEIEKRNLQSGLRSLKHRLQATAQVEANQKRREDATFKENPEKTEWQKAADAFTKWRNEKTEEFNQAAVPYEEIRKRFQNDVASFFGSEIGKAFEGHVASSLEGQKVPRTETGWKKAFQDWWESDLGAQHRSLSGFDPLKNRNARGRFGGFANQAGG